MHFGQIIDAWTKLARAALAVFVLAAAPLADALACSADGVGDASHAIVAIDAGADDHQHDGHDDGNQPFEGEHCAHGHCHHSVALNAGSVSQARIEARDGPAVPEAVAPIRNLPGGLERPPKT